MITERLDRIASDLESKGLLKEAADIDAVSNAIEAAVSGTERKVYLTPGQKKKFISDPDYSRIARELKVKVNDVQLLRLDGQPVKHRLVFFGEGEPVKTIDLRHFDAPGMEFTLDSFSMLANPYEVPKPGGPGE